MFSRKIKSALLVDFDNIGSTVMANKAANWTAWLEDGGYDPARVKRAFISKKVYWNSQYDLNRVPFERAGFEIEVCIARRKEKASSADFEITIDAMDLLYRRKDLDEVVILSCDTDFLSVLHRLQEGKVDVTAMVRADAEAEARAKNKTPVFRDRANFVITDVELKGAFDYERPKRRWFGAQRAPAAANGSAPAQAVRPAASPVRASQPAIRKSNADPAAARADVARRLAHAAALRPNRPLPGKVVLSLLNQTEGYAGSGPDAFFGFKSFTAMIRGLAALEQHMQVIFISGRPALIWRGPPRPAEDAA